MMKEEFFRIINTRTSDTWEEKIGDQDYEKIEEVYLFYPTINTKELLVELIINHGMLIIEDMLGRAGRIKDLEEKLKSAQHYELQLKAQILRESGKPLTPCGPPYPPDIIR